jgi:hypothetical protein
MAYVAYVDVSAKIEQWTKDSAIALSNGKSRVYLVKSKVKQRLRQLLTKQHGGSSVNYRIFALLVYLVARDELNDIVQLVIDKDYTGKEVEATIKNLLLALLQNDKPELKAGFIRFENVRGRNADILARNVYQGVVLPTRVVGFQEIEALLKK